MVFGARPFGTRAFGDSTAQATLPPLVYSGAQASETDIANAGSPRVVGTTFRTEILADSPAGFWMLNETSGTTATDLSGNGRHGTYSGSPTLGQLGINGNSSTSFDGSNDEVTIAANSVWNANASNGVTIELWYKGTQTGGNNPGDNCCYIACNDDFDHKNWGLYPDASGKVRSFNEDLYVMTGPGTGPAINNNVWHQMVLTITAANYDTTIFVDGVSVATNTAANDPGFGNAVLRIARNFRSNGNQWCSGNMTGVAIFPAVLSGARILAHYNAGISNDLLGTGSIATETDTANHGFVVSPNFGPLPGPLLVVS